MKKHAMIFLGMLLAGGCAMQQHKTQSPPPLDPKLHDLAEQELSDAEQSKNAFTRSNAIEARQDVDDPAAQASILQGLHDPSDVVRFSAAMAAGRLHLATVKPDLRALLNDPSEIVDVGAIYALYCLGDAGPAHRLEKLAFNIDPQVRANVALAIGLMGNPTGLRVLRAMAHDASAMVRFQVAESRWQLGDLDGLTDLVSGTVSKYPDEQIVCILGLAAPRDPRVAEHIRTGLVSRYPEVALAAARAMGELGSDEGFPTAMSATKSNDPRQRSLAALALGAIGRRDAQPVLAELVKDYDPDVRVAAATAILQLK